MSANTKYRTPNGWAQFGIGSLIDANPTSGSVDAVSSGGVYSALSAKQNALTFDSAPISGSTNPVTSGGIKTYVDGMAREYDTWVAEPIAVDLSRVVSVPTGDDHQNYAYIVELDETINVSNYSRMTFNIEQYGGGMKGGATTSSNYIEMWLGTTTDQYKLHFTNMFSPNGPLSSDLSFPLYKNTYLELIPSTLSRATLQMYMLSSGYENGDYIHAYNIGIQNQSSPGTGLLINNVRLYFPNSRVFVAQTYGIRVTIRGYKKCFIIMAELN